MTHADNWQARKIRLATSHQSQINQVGVNNIEFTDRKNKTLKRTDGHELTEFVSCSYLGLETHPLLVTSAKDALDHFGVQFAAARTRVMPAFYSELDRALSQIFANTFITTFNAVSPCHAAVFPLLASGELPHFQYDNYPLFLMDRTSHASIQLNRGLLAQFGEVRRIDCSNADLVENAVSDALKGGRKPIVITDSVGSMGGLFPVWEITDILGKSGGYVYFDDAHGTSVFGAKGQGYVLEQLQGDLPPHVILAGSLSKAFGAHGGFVASRFEETNNFIRRFGSTYIFGGPPSLPGLASCLAAGKLHLGGTVDRLQRQLAANLRLFDSLRKNTINHGTAAPIRGIRVGDEFKAIKLAQSLQAKGYMTTTAMFPTVRKGEAMLRCAISAQHRPYEIEGLLAAYEEIEMDFGLEMAS